MEKQDIGGKSLTEPLETVNSCNLLDTAGVKNGPMMEDCTLLGYSHNHLRCSLIIIPSCTGEELRMAHTSYASLYVLEAIRAAQSSQFQR